MKMSEVCPRADTCSVIALGLLGLGVWGAFILQATNAGKSQLDDRPGVYTWALVVELITFRTACILCSKTGELPITQFERGKGVARRRDQAGTELVW